MTKKLRIAVSVLLVCALGFTAWQALRPRGPVYQGKTLRVWLREFEDTNKKFGGAKSMQLFELTRIAVRAMGTNALPELMQMVGATNSPLKLKLTKLASKQSLVHWHPTMAADDHLLALEAFSLLGPLAKPAVPGLVKLLSSGNADVRAASAASLGHIGPEAQDAVPSLLQLLNDPDSEVRVYALRSIGRIHVQPALAIPAIAKCLNSGDPPTVCAGLFALGCFAGEAGSTVAAIQSCLTHPEEAVRDSATNALKQIDREAATKAGVK